MSVYKKDEKIINRHNKDRVPYVETRRLQFIFTIVLYVPLCQVIKLRDLAQVEGRESEGFSVSVSLGD